MATPRATRYRPRHARPAALPRTVSRTVGVAGLATATTFTLLPAGSAGAQSAPTILEVQATIAQLDVAADTAVEEFRQAEQALEESARRAAAAREQVAREQARLEQVREEMGAVVAAAYRRGSTDRLVSLVADADPRTFLDRASTLDRVARSQSDALGDVQAVRLQLARTEQAAERELAAQRDAEVELAERKAGIERALAEQRRLLDSLQAEQRRQVEAARQAALVAAQAPAQAPARASRTRGAAPAAPAPAAAPSGAAAPAAAAPAGGTYNGPASGRAKTALDEAHRQLGKPYRYGGNGPDSFDCSGFTSWAWRAAGVSLPRTSRDQYAQGRKVAREDLQPGDLVFFGSPIHHVGIYVGDGRMIHAPSSGKTVHITELWRRDYAGAVRP